MSKKQPKITLNFRWTHLIHNKDELIFWSCSIVDHWLNYFKNPLKSTFGYILGTQKWPSVSRSIVSFLRGCDRFYSSKDVLLQTWERKHESECLQCMSRSLFRVWGHIRNDILRRGRMGIVRTYQECLIHALYVIPWTFEMAVTSTKNWVLSKI